MVRRLTASFAAASIFYNALLPETGPAEELGRTSGIAWGIGYLGGALILVLNLVMLKKRLADAEKKMPGMDDRVKAAKIEAQKMEVEIFQMNQPRPHRFSIQPATSR